MTNGEYIGAGSGTTKLLLHLNGNSTDSSGNGNNGIDTAITYVDGKFGKCASVAGTGRIVTTSNIGITGQGARTIAGWFNCQTQPSVDQYLFTLGKLSAGNLFALKYSSVKKGGFSLYGTDLVTTSVLTPLTSVGWHFICITYSGGALSSSSLKFSIDGVDYPFASYSGTPNTTDFTVSIGDYGNNSGYGWKGYFDEVIIENRAWSAQEVKKYYTQSRGFFATL